MAKKKQKTTLAELLGEEKSDTTPTVGPPRVPDGWISADPEMTKEDWKELRSHGATFVFIGEKKYIPLGKTRVMIEIDKHLECAGLNAVIHCITPPTTGDASDGPTGPRVFEAFAEVAIQRADGTWYEFDFKTFEMKSALVAAEAEA